ncbi:MAG: ABC transporter permease [Duncaniella sp.]|nr:ABC transporter permease [Bacteroides sp.]MDE5827484.1 ABC transporter permease [Duncaniella sp.]MDE6061259.1 ABC transporter permease [Duncaniella sp.]MDE6431307.1 ABC transporter permease [Duncaniella sp.]MDE6812421.1 ABC transporter permease [Duncaniella sp.]
MLLKIIKRELRRLTSRKIYIFMMLIVPLGFTFFFLNLMNEGLPLRIPVGMVDLDHTSLSRKVGRALNASELIDLSSSPENFHQAMQQVKSGEIYGFFLIPNDFQQKAIGGGTPTLSFYSNMTIFVPGSLSFKGFKTIAVTTSGGIVKTTLVGMGLGEETAGSLIQPVVINSHPLNNPWLNYSFYLSQSFIPCLLALIVLLITVFSICEEKKRGTSVEWLAMAKGNMAVALAGKLLPQTVIFTIVGVTMQAIMFGFLHFPLNCHPLHMILAVLLLVMASQAFATFITEMLPNLRMAMSIVSLVGILCFSIAGFSFPVDKMYGGVAIFSYILPIRYYFLIYIDQALNGIPLYYSRFYYIALLVFLFLPLLGLRRLAKQLAHPVYVE